MNLLGTDFLYLLGDDPLVSSTSSFLSIEVVDEFKSISWFTRVLKMLTVPSVQ